MTSQDFFSTGQQPPSAQQRGQSTSISDLQRLVDNVRIDGSVTAATIDEVAESIRLKLEVKTEDNRLFHDLADLLLKRCTMNNQGFNEQSNADENRQRKSPCKQDSAEETCSSDSSIGASPDTRETRDSVATASRSMSPSQVSQNEDSDVDCVRGRSPGRWVSERERTRQNLPSPLRFLSRRPPTPDRSRRNMTPQRERGKMSPVKTRSRSPFRFFRRSGKAQEQASPTSTTALPSSSLPVAGEESANAKPIPQNLNLKVSDRPPSGRCRSPSGLPPSPVATSFSPTESNNSHSPSFATTIPKVPEEAKVSVDEELENNRSSGVDGTADKLQHRNVEREKPPLSRPTPIVTSVETVNSLDSYSAHSNIQPTTTTPQQENKQTAITPANGQETCETHSRTAEDPPVEVPMDQPVQPNIVATDACAPSSTGDPVHFPTPHQPSQTASTVENAIPPVSDVGRMHVSSNTTRIQSRNFNDAEQGHVTGKGKVPRKADQSDPPAVAPIGAAQQSDTGAAGQPSDTGAAHRTDAPSFADPSVEVRLFEVDLKTSNSLKHKMRPKRSGVRRNKGKSFRKNENGEPAVAADSFGRLGFFSEVNSSFDGGTVSQNVSVDTSQLDSDVSMMETDNDSVSEVGASEPPQRFSVPVGVSDFKFSVGVTSGKTIASPRRRRGTKGRPSRFQQRVVQSPRPHAVPQSTEEHDPPNVADKADRTDQSMQSTASSVRVDFSGKIGMIQSLQKDARKAHLAADYRSSVSSYTRAIQLLSSEGLEHTVNDMLAALFCNRAIGLLMLGAFDAAISDCRRGLVFVSESSPSSCTLSHDCGPVLKSKLYTRLGEALLKMGDSRAADKAFDCAIETAHAALNICRLNHTREELERDEEIVMQVVTDATLGKTNALRYSEIATKIARNSMPSSHRTLASERRIYVEMLAQVNIALSTASGCPSLHEKKVSLLANLRRWREVAGHCERLAVSSVQMDNIMTGDLAAKYPFPGVPAAKVLTANFFGDSNDEDFKSAELKLNSKAAAEAVLRLPASMTSFYLRALRLEERYPAAEAAFKALEAFVNDRAESHPHDRLRVKFAWLPREHSKLNRTKRGRERGDELFRAGDFDLAAAQYASCLTIDSEGVADNSDVTNSAGGRLHAVLHCNRAACLMAVRRFHDAVTECTAALRIHSRYMKAMLRRARCFSRLERYEESVVEYKRWLELVEEAKKPTDSTTGFVTPCLFDGPRDVALDDILQVTKELEEVLKLKHKKESAAKEEARYRHERQKFHHEAYSDAQRRRENWYSQKGSSGSRRWDTFGGKSPRRTSKNSQSNHNNQNNHNNSNNSESWRSDSWRQSQYGYNNYNNSSNSDRVNVSNSPGTDVDHYRALQVGVSATAAEIKKAYRKMALKYHPDKNKNPGAADTFRRIKLAYEVLNDPASRRQYDMERVLKRTY